MIENRGFDILDYLIILSKWKKVLLFVILLSGVITYLAVHFLISPKYDATALIVPSEQDQTNSIGALLKSFSNIPVSIPGIKGDKNDIFRTIVYSRTMLEKLITKFGLEKEYNMKYHEDLLEAVTKDINAEENKDGAYEIKVRSSSPQKAADMTNFIVNELNSTVIEMNVHKSRDNKIFLEKRYNEIKTNLKVSEDSLSTYQKKSGILMADVQSKATIEAYTRMEGELIAKESELAVLKSIYGDDSQQYKNAFFTFNEYKTKLADLKSGKENADFLIAAKKLPAGALKYARLYREVTINNKMLEFIVPLYEQVRYEEQKDIPILQIVDYAQAPDKKAYPRTLLITGIVELIVFFLSVFMIFMREILVNSDNPKVEQLRKSLRFRK